MVRHHQWYIRRKITHPVCFIDMHHGFAAARGDWNDEVNKKRATEAVQLTANFFKATLTA